jgi:hypothetical protein
VEAVRILAPLPVSPHKIGGYFLSVNKELYLEKKISEKMLGICSYQFYEKKIFFNFF